VREKHCSRLEIYDRLQASEQAANWKVKLSSAPFHLYCSDFKSISEKLRVVVQMYELRFFFQKKRIKIFHHSLDHGGIMRKFH